MVKMNFTFHKDLEDHLTYFDNPNRVVLTHLAIFDFFADPNRDNDILISDAYIRKN